MSRWDGLADDHRRATHAWSRIRKYLPPVNFITIHYAYFLIVCLVSSVIFWGSSHPARSVSYTDCLFLVVSAMTEAGLNTVNLSTLTTWQQIIIFLLIMFGSTIWVSIWTVLARKHVFQRRFDDIVRIERAKRSDRHSTVLLPKLRQTISFRKAQTVPKPDMPPPMVSIGGESEKRQAAQDGDGQSNGGLWRPTSRGAASLPERHGQRPSLFLDDTQLGDEGAAPSGDAGHIIFVDRPHPRQQGDGPVSATAGQEELHKGSHEAVKAEGHGEGQGFDIHHFLKNKAPGRHGEFHGLTRHERTQLGGCEYRALRILAAIVPLYFFLWQILGCIGLGAWMNYHMPNTARENGINPWWLGVFNGVSAFNNSGMSLLDANMVPFQGAYYVLITMGLMILAGNTAYPIFLRFIIWSWLTLLRKTTSKEAFRDTKIALEFILIYPRRVYTNLFPSRPTWWLLFMLICLNGVDWVLFELLNIGNPVIESIPPGPRSLDGLFQALAVRSGGFYVVPIAQIAIAVQFLYVVMMYISVYPVVITMRHSNLYEERSLGIYGDEDPSNPDNNSEDDGPILPQHYPSLEPFSFTTSSDRASTITRRPTLAHRISNSNTATDVGRVLQRSLTFQGVGIPRMRKMGNKHDDLNLSSPNGRSNYPDNRIGFVSQQIHGQLAHDIWWLVLAALVITAIETSHFNADPVVFSVFNVIFEVVSAYGTVGISVGIPTDAYSFCGAWHTPSKLVLCLVMLRGRHRGLPVALDHAVRLPGEHLQREEEEDHKIRRSMTERRMSFRS